MAQLVAVLPPMPLVTVIRPELAGPSEILCLGCRRFRMRVSVVPEVVVGDGAVRRVLRGVERWECWTCWTAVEVRFGRRSGETS